MKKINYLFIANLIFITSLSFSQIQIGSDIDGGILTRSDFGGSTSISSDGSTIAVGGEFNGNFTGHVRVYKNYSGTWVQYGQDIDGEHIGDRFGFSVSLSFDGSRLAIGSLTNSDGALWAGHVRIFEDVAGTWTQIGVDLDGEAIEDYFGYDISLSYDGNMIAIGAREADTVNGIDSGRVRVFRDVSGVWTQVGGDIAGEAAGDWAGSSVSLSSDGSIVAFVSNNQAYIYRNVSGTWSQVGSSISETDFIHKISLNSAGNKIAASFPNEHTINGAQSGVVRVYENQSDIWTQVGEKINGEAELDSFGDDLELNSVGDVLIIGSKFNDGNGVSSGHTRIYEDINGTWTQIGADIDGEAAGDYSGASVSLNSDGSIIIIGAPHNDANGNSSGQVRIFENVSGVWTQIGADIDGETSKYESGKSVRLNGDGSIVAIGAPGSDMNGPESGCVRIFEDISGVWTQLGTDINGELIDDISGWSVSLNGDGSIVAIGATGNDGVNGADSGHVRVFENVSGTWTQIGADIDGEAAGDYSGTSVSLNLSGNIVAIGAQRNDGVNGVDSGHVRVYENLSGTWTQIGADIDGEAAGDRSGYSVSLSDNGSIIAIGGYWNDGINGSNSGHVRIYENLAGTWTQIGVDIDGEAAGDISGWSVSLNGDGSIVAIGATGNDGVNGADSGHVRVFENVSGTWTQIGVDIDGEAAGDISGWDININSEGNVLAIAARDNNENGANSGLVRVYKNISGTWTQIGNDIDGEAAGDRSGWSVSLNSDGTRLAIGARYNDGNGDISATNSGHVRVYDLNAALSIQQNTFGAEFNVYPNPSNGVSKIDLGENYSEVNIHIMDVLGKVVDMQNYTSTSFIELNTEEYTSGIYFIKVKSGVKEATIKLVVE